RGAPARAPAPARPSPALGVSRSATMRRSVVFPHPDGPTSATSSAGGTSRSTRSRASGAPKRRETDRIEIGTDTLLLDLGEEGVRRHLGNRQHPRDPLVLPVKGHHAFPDLRGHPEEPGRTGGREEWTDAR